MTVCRKYVENFRRIDNWSKIRRIFGRKSDELKTKVGFPKKCIAHVLACLFNSYMHLGITEHRK